MDSDRSSSETFAHRIVRHFRSIQRDLPWRRTADPYAIWISEIMLQQTRVATVIPYYRRWLERFPTVSALAQAPLDDVLAAWSGLGYYSRARNIHRCAQEIVAHHRGVLPDSAAALRKLPGIGPYTAGAISSIAYQQREPVVDGNVARVLARAYEIELDIKSTAGSRALWQLAGELVPASAPGDFNQGLMELGATVCTPTRPNCLLCPVATLCRARASGRQNDLPRKAPRKKTDELPVLATSALWAARRGRLLLARRPPQGLYGGLWELPQTTDPSLLEDLLPPPARIAALELVTEHRQVLSHRQLHIRVFRAEVRGVVGKVLRARYSQPTSATEPDYEAFAWHPLASLADCGVSAATRAIVEQLEEVSPWKTHRTATRKPSRSSTRATKRSSPG